MAAAAGEVQAVPGCHCPSRTLRRLALVTGHLSSARAATGGAGHRAQPAPAPPLVAAPSSAANMSARELYQLDTLGFLKVEQCITRTEALAAYARSEQMIETYGEQIRDAPLGAGYGDKYRNAVLYDKMLERLAYDPRLLGYACQLLNNQPRLVSGTMMVQHHHHDIHGFHGQKEYVMP
jgi:hypothetical protein